MPLIIFVAVFTFVCHQLADTGEFRFLVLIYTAAALIMSVAGAFLISVFLTRPLSIFVDTIGRSNPKALEPGESNPDALNQDILTQDAPEGDFADTDLQKERGSALGVPENQAPELAAIYRNMNALILQVQQDKKIWMRLPAIFSNTAVTSRLFSAPGKED